ncbi:MAG: 2-oxoacid:acceptor oxidoreductase family protein [Deltaproteobacteria bacterium]|nr:2-oxoacid:acceptor oxidoreductase family protein [Deltaproteobacteria bacterium]
MKEIRIHGRGGQGAVTAGDMIVTAAVLEGKYGTSFPLYGDARRGAPVVTFLAIDDVRIRQKTRVYTPDCLIVLDPRQFKWPQTYEGIKRGGMLILNYGEKLSERPHSCITRAGTVDATKIAMEEIGIPAFNTCILGAFAATTGWVKLDAVLFAIEKTFSGELATKNIRSAERGYREAHIQEWPLKDDQTNQRGP